MLYENELEVFEDGGWFIGLRRLVLIAPSRELKLPRLMAKTS
jgi:hypothetical protein